MIHWTQFDWPSFAALVGAVATLIVGVVGVMFAYRVGVKQASIAHRQADILDRQTALAETTLKADLFERRLATYEAAANFLNYIGDLGESEEGKARISLFATKMRESQFLFRPEVYQVMVEIWEAGNKMRVARAISISNHQEGLPRDPAYWKAIDEVTVWSTKRVETLHEVFRPDLELGARGLMPID